MKFRGACRSKPEPVRPKCGVSSPSGFIFRGECGHDLRAPHAAAPPKDLSSDDKLAEVRKNHPSGPAEKVLSQKSRIEAERSRDILARSCSWVAHGIGRYYKGFFQEADRHPAQGATLCERSNTPSFLFLAHWYLGEIRVDTRGYEASESHYSDAVGVIERFELPPSRRNLAYMGRARGRVLNKSRDLELETLYGYVNRNRVRMPEGRMRTR
jgi:hypothetical protein